MKKVLMEVLHKAAAGLDVHKEVVVACRRRQVNETDVESEVKQFRTTTRGLRELSAWLKEWDILHVAMESTGVYWVPIWNLLQSEFELMLVNAQYLKKVPGRKTDIVDAEGIAQLHQCGLLRGSFVPSESVREWRELTRQRMKLLDQRTSVINRIQKVLEQANSKLSSVTSDVMCVSGRRMLQAMSDGEHEASVLAEMARGRLREKGADLRESLEGRMTENQEWLLQRMLSQIDFLESEIELYDQRIAELMRPFEPSLKLLDTIDGVDWRTAENLLAELGPEMKQFPSDDELASWAGMSPGNNESAGKRKSGKTAKGNRWLRRVLVQAAWGGVRKKNSYVAAQFGRLAARRGKKRAIVAVGRTILIAAYHVLKEEVEYQDLGGNYFDQLNEERTKSYLVHRLESLGYEVSLKELKQVA
jgi:transposase